jgi:hypothetical protein
VKRHQGALRIGNHSESNCKIERGFCQENEPINRERREIRERKIRDLFFAYFAPFAVIPYPCNFSPMIPPRILVVSPLDRLHCG